MTVFSLIVILALCVTAACAATLNTNMVNIEVTQNVAIVTTTAPVYASCPAGYDCMTGADATAQLGTYAKYSDAVCGYKQSSTTVALIRVPQYCVKKVTTPVYATCPSGYDCLTDADATTQFGTSVKYSDAVCGYKQNTATAVAVIRTPQYCVKQATTPGQTTCPADCSCMMESTAKDKFQGVYKKCGDKPCQTVVTGAAQVNAYCFGPGTTTTTPSVTCKDGCTCISEATAKAKGGTWTHCQEDICGYEQSTATFAAVVQVPKYCMKQQETTPVCPDGCSCLSDADAKIKGLTTKCDENEEPCGYQSIAATANTQATRIPLYCYKIGITVTPTPQVCKEKGCYCVQEAEAKLKFGPNNYTRCQADICGYDPSATTANGIPKYCFKPTITPAPSDCPQGCACTTNATAVEKGLTFCGGKLTSCGYDENKQPQYCFQEVPSPTCVYDYQKNVCSGTCDQGYACGLLASKKDATGKVVYAVCGCTGQSTTPCTYDAQKNACTGTCQTGAACSVVGKNVDEKTGATTPVCGCPQQSSCVYDYSKEACVGTCKATGDVCQLNTIYRDPTTGKVTYAECHCKGGGETTPTCACDAASGACTGTCASGKACTMTERTTDNAGKIVCKSCGCTDTCVLDANNRCSGTCSDGGQCTSITTKDDSGQEKVSCGCGGISQAGTPAGIATRQPGIFEAIASFFNKLFGGK